MLDQDLWTDIHPYLQARGPLVYADLSTASTIEDMAAGAAHGAGRGV
jgi:hypothetical protein